MVGLRRGAFTRVRCQLTLCDPIWQVTLCSSGLCFPLTVELRSLLLQPQHQTSSVRRHTTPVATTHSVSDVTMTSSSSTLDRAAPGRAVSGVSSPVLANQLVTGSCRELRSGMPVVRSPNKSMERPLGLFSLH